jgi:hypothetical protein
MVSVKFAKFRDRRTGERRDADSDVGLGEEE